MNYPLTLGTFTTPRGTPVEMVYREGTNDWNTLTSCLTEDEYHLRDRSLTGTALDIGAHIGGVSIALAVDNPGLRIIAIEPVPPNLALLRRNVERLQLQGQIEVVAGAVGDGSRQRIRYGFVGDEVAEHHAFIGNVTLVDWAILPHDQVDYDTLTLDDLLTRDYSMVDGIEFLKIDTEGAEYPLFGSASRDALRSVRTIAGEWHNNDGHVIGDIVALLDPTHHVTTTGPAAGPGGFEATLR